MIINQMASSNPPMNGAFWQMVAMESSVLSRHLPQPIQSVRVFEIPINEDTGDFFVPKSTTSDHQELVFADLPASSTIEVDGKELKEWQHESQRAISGRVKVPGDTSSLPEDVVWYIQTFVGRPKLYVFQCYRCQYIDRDLKKYAVHRPTTSRRRGNPNITYIMVDRHENGHVVTNAGLCQRYFVKRADVQFQNEFAFLVNGNEIIRVDAIWLLTRNHFHKDEYLLLPFPVLYFVASFCPICIQSPIPVYTQDENIGLLPTNNVLSSCVQQIKECVLVYPQTAVRLPSRHALFCIWVVLLYENKPVKIRKGRRKIFTHPIRKLEITLNEEIKDLSGDGHYFREVLPLAFNETVPQDFVVYQIIYQKPPADPTTNVMAGVPYNSMLNAARLDVLLSCEWDETVLKEQFGAENLNRVSLACYGETVNIGVEAQGMFGIRFH